MVSKELKAYKKTKEYKIAEELRNFYDMTPQIIFNMCASRAIFDLYYSGDLPEETRKEFDEKMKLEIDKLDENSKEIMNKYFLSEAMKRKKDIKAYRKKIKKKVEK